MTDTRDQRLLTRAAANLAGVLAHTDSPPYLHDGVAVHAMAAAGHLTRVTGRSGLAAPIDTSPNALEIALRDTLRSLALLSAETFDSDGILDTIRELQSALAATG